METMNYGLINYQKQNGKTGIFWQSEQKKKVDRKFGYRSKEQKFSIRQHPKNFDRLESEEEQILTIGGTDKENEKRKPEKDFIARNRTLVKNKNKKTTKKDSNAPKNESDSLMTLTQAQLNAILASVGKVASGKEDNLRISIDSSKNEIKIESPRKSKELDYDRYSDHESDADDDKYSRDRYEKEKKNSNKKKEKKEDSIFDLLGDTTKQNRKKQAAVAKLTLEEDERLQKEKQERKEYDKKRAEKKAREERKERDRREREKSEERERERRWEEDREREYRDRREKEERRDEIRERKERRHRDKSHERESHRHRNNSRERKRTPSESEDYHTSNDKSNDKDETKKEVLHLPPAGPRALTLAEKKRLQWEQERKEQEKRYDPWGRPGAGAPIRTRSGNIAADYRSRQVPSRTIVRQHNLCLMD